MSSRCIHGMYPCYVKHWEEGVRFQIGFLTFWLIALAVQTVTNFTLQDVQSRVKRGLCLPLSDQIVLIGSFCPSTSPGVNWEQNDTKNIEMFIKFFDTEHCTHTYLDYMRNGEPLETVRRIDIQISQSEHVWNMSMSVNLKLSNQLFQPSLV